MKTSVELQAPFQYMILWLILAVLFIAGVIIAQVLLRKRLGDRLKKAKQIKLKRIAESTLEGLKKKYIGELTCIEMDLRNQKITVRQAYQKMSICIRLFVHDVTGIKVQKYTLSEIKKVNMPQLTNLVREYYEPEFALESRTDVMGSVQRTRAVIESWRK
ncbi:MAG: hypothetical protein K6B68_16280 [Eubacterium sp.]|nr:hypothetical protein [Eubacterium sp.]